ncbi:MAG: ribonuclease Z [Clostridia bacterium]|nr:ribonuclease Z [Clostridia bacterium]
MKITFLGTSHGYAEKGRFTSATLIEVGENYYLLDAGAPIEYLFVNNDKPYENLRGIFLTHMHNDHVGSLSSVVEPMLRYRFNDKATCFFPSRQGMDGFANWLYTLDVKKEVLDKTVKFELVNEGKIFDDGKVCVYARRNLHKGVGGASFGYIFEAEGKRVFFTGDMSQEFSEYCEYVGSEHYDLVVCEGAHSPIVRAAEKLKGTNTDRMIINHVYFESVEGFDDVAKTLPFPCEIAEDMLEIKL